MTDPIAEKARKIGGTTLRSIGQIPRTQRIADNDAEFVEPQDMLAELRDGNLRLTSAMREVHNICEEYGDVATASLLEAWIDETERRTWFLYEASHRTPSFNGNASGEKVHLRLEAKALASFTAPGYASFGDRITEGFLARGGEWRPFISVAAQKHSRSLACVRPCTKLVHNPVQTAQYFSPKLCSGTVRCRASVFADLSSSFIVFLRHRKDGCCTQRV